MPLKYGLLSGDFEHSAYMANGTTLKTGKIYVKMANFIYSDSMRKNR